MARLNAFVVSLVLLLAHAQIGSAFSDGSFQRTCTAPNQMTGQPQPVLEQNVGNVMGFHGFTSPLPNGGWLIQWNVPKMVNTPPLMRRFLFYHECAHARRATSDEATADCEGLRHMKHDIGVTPNQVQQMAAFYAQYGRVFPPPGCKY